MSRTASSPIVELFVPAADVAAKTAAAASYPKIAMDKTQCQWLQTLSEGWASPLKGFMREKEFLQCIHFAMIDGCSQSVPITLQIDDATKEACKDAKQVTLTYEGKDMAILSNPEIFAAVKEEQCSRIYGLHDPKHPYVAQIYAWGNHCIGGDLEVLQRITWGDGLDQYRNTPAELRAKTKAMGADAVFAFQLRNPVHNGHALLMTDTAEKLKARGFKKPVLILHPLGGFTKNDDVPLDVRMAQHDCVLNEKVLDPEATIVAIFPSPMIYAGPTEVQWHAKSRQVAGAQFYIVGRDPAGMAHPSEDRDMFQGHHGREVLQMAPGLGELEIIPFLPASYDTKLVRKDGGVGGMNFLDFSRMGDFISISGTKMRKYARDGETPPEGYMCPTGWAVVAAHYTKLAAAKAAAEAAGPDAKKARTA